MTDHEESAGVPDKPAAWNGGRFSGRRVVRLCKLLSRVLGFIRETAIASLWGLSPVLDAFVGAFKIPNLARGLFGEGALGAAFTRLFVREQEQRGQDAAMRLA